MPGVLPYEPINSLFADYAHKKRFVWMPEGTQATYDGDGKIFDFPQGTILVKTFFYENVLPANDTQIIETRIYSKEMANGILLIMSGMKNKMRRFWIRPIPVIISLLNGCRMVKP